MKQSEQINELAAALAKAQGAIENAVKDKANPFFKSTYADLAGVWDACRAALSNNGLSVIQSPEESEKGIAITTMLLHSSGQWICGTYNMPVSKLDAQAVGSAITYARRYALSAMIGIAAEDDDGNSASNKKANAGENNTPVRKTEQELPQYPEEQLEANKAAWLQRIQSGKQSPDDLIKMISTKYTLTEQQKQQIKDLK